MQAKDLSLDDTYYIGIETRIEGVGPALRLTNNVYATREEAEQALSDVRRENADARVCDWSDLFDIDNPVEVIWPEISHIPEFGLKQEGIVSANIQDDSEQAADQAIANILSHTVGGEITEPVCEIVYKHWLPYMAECFIKHGSDSQQWHSVIQAFLHFTNATLGTRNYKNISKEYGSEEEFITRLASIMPQSQLGVFLQRQSLKPLQEWLINVAKPGIWFKIYVGDDKPKRILKLSSISDDASTLKFSDRTGKHALELEMFRFLDDMKESRSSMIQGEGNFDSALTHIIDNNRRSVEKNREV